MQDFSRKISLVINKDIEKWQAVNAVAHISAYMGNKMPQPFDTGESFTTADGISYPRNSQYAIIVLQSDHAGLQSFMNRVRNSKLLSHAFIREMIETTDDTEIEKIVSEKKDSEIEYLGIGVFGTIEEVNSLTKGFGLWKL